MRAVETAGTGGPEVLSVASGLAIPVPGPEEVLIRVAAAGVNRPDIMQRRGIFPPPPGASPILGLEVAGRIEARGAQVTGLKIGDEVCALVPSGGYAEYCVADSGLCLPVPAGLGARDVAGLPEALFTLWSNLFDTAGLKAGERVLIHGGASGIGSIAIQLAKAFGAEVFTTAGGSEKTDFCRLLGADVVIDYRNQDFAALVQEKTGGQGVDVILDMVGGDYLSRNLVSLATGGRLVVIGMQSGATAPLDLSLLMAKRGGIFSSSLRGRSLDEKRRIARRIAEHAWPKVASGEIRSRIDSVYPLDQVAAAHERLESGRHLGKILLDLA
ncbi:NAD(P)H-quinone oxidoreductase [Telmatospirillum sp. J64-1]|uniref:NAD(P)H-quinone oxidoreductase n=1 Tax=Telmatospirillum sp. J64-1 TaxID=2502183 RepID=UPI00115F57E8|nr:NAD(P)H-quinone oxidoreductase [Telmatospirillum sp. J64-1]